MNARILGRFFNHTQLVTVLNRITARGHTVTIQAGKNSWWSVTVLNGETGAQDMQTVIDIKGPWLALVKACEILDESP